MIKENLKKEDELFVIRYEPSQEWLDNGHDLENYEGKITFYSIQGGELSSMKIQKLKIVITNKFVKHI